MKEPRIEYSRLITHDYVKFGVVIKRERSLNVTLLYRRNAATRNLAR